MVHPAATAALVQSNFNTAEIGIPWSELGGAPGATGRRLRFTAVVFRASGAAPADGAASRVVDAVSPLAALAEVNDGVVDGNGGSPAYFDVNFDAAGKVFAPLLVSEFVPNPFGTNTAQWVEIANTSGAPVSLAGTRSAMRHRAAGLRACTRCWISHCNLGRRPCSRAASCASGSLATRYRRARCSTSSAP